MMTNDPYSRCARCNDVLAKRPLVIALHGLLYCSEECAGPDFETHGEVVDTRDIMYNEVAMWKRTNYKKED